jgi:hypothetical protein
LGGGFMEVGIFIFLSLCATTTFAHSCLPIADLIARDSKYEEALRVGDVAFLDNLLADEFVWVHNLASAVEDKATILARSKAPTEIPKARTTSDVRAHALENTVVLQGLSHVEKWNSDGKTTRSLRYQFMRTYVSTVKG